ncbi:MAG TPA: D-glycero-beta-D-manno-heptose 1,7-bisphosphate 7-phosphatase [Gammaproteobacteria bacterium]|nr:D-glycero-beta-D-manno-heptose 1,7-bisphosphate 7-phosphatase [Gammaproteobacteria bacterium]
MPLIILDRDGVINQDSDRYIRTVDEFIPIPGSLDAIVRLNQAGYTVLVATNQSGLARGYFDADTLAAMHHRLDDLLGALGGHIDGIYVCPHGPDDDCDCRKPRAGLLEQIARDYDTDLHDVPVVGDSLRDLQAALKVGARPLLVRTGKGERTLASGAPELAGIPVYADLAACVNDLLTED